MKATLLPLFLLIAGTQAISNSAYNKNFTYQGAGLIQSNGQKAQELLEYSTSSASQTSTGKFYGSIEEGTRMLNDKVEECTNEHTHELSITLRKAQGSGRAGAGGSRGSKGVYGYGDHNVYHKPSSRYKSSAPPSLSLSWPSFWTSTFIICVSLDLIILFPLHF